MCWSTTPIHGSAGADSTLIDTVGQKLRGIPPHVRSALAGLFEGHHVVVLGHSGGDLEFGNTLALCMRLLSSSGRTSVAGTIWQHLADTIDRRKSPTMVSLEPAVRALAAEGHRLFGIQAQKGMGLPPGGEDHIRVELEQSVGEAWYAIRRLSRARRRQDDPIVMPGAKLCTTRDTWTARTSD